MELHLWLTPSTGMLLYPSCVKNVLLLQGLAVSRKVETVLQMFFKHKTVNGGIGSRSHITLISITGNGKWMDG